MIAVALVLLAGSAHALGRSPESPPGDRVEKTSLQLIAEALEEGRIDGDTATVYQVYAVVDDDKLPPEYRGTLPIKDGTPVLRHARSRYEELGPDAREALRPYLFPRGDR